MTGSRPPTVVVTGASGFVGRHLVAALAARGFRVRAVSRTPGIWAHDDRIEAVAVGDLAGEVAWPALVAGASHVVHLAGIAHASRAIPEARYMAVNAEATARLATAARSAGVRRLVLVSSVRAQCGPCAVGVLTEASAPVPDDAYGRSKLAGERLLAQTLPPGGDGCDWCVLRPVVVYGPGVKANMAALSRLARSPLPLPLAGLRGRRSIVGLDTLTSAIGHALESPRASRGTFLVAEPGALTVAGIVGAMRVGLDRPAGVFGVPMAPARLAARLLGKGGAWQRLDGDLVVSTAALEATGWRPPETAAAGLARWLRQARRG